MDTGRVINHRESNSQLPELKLYLTFTGSNSLMMNIIDLVYAGEKKNRKQTWMQSLKEILSIYF